MLLFFVCCILLTACVAHGDFSTSSTSVPSSSSSISIDFNNISFSQATVDLFEAQNGLGSNYSAIKTVEMTEYNGTTYAFEPHISLEDRWACMESTEAILSRLPSVSHLQINIYGVDSYGFTFIDTGVVNTYAQDWSGVDYTTAVLYGVFGEYCNYGMIYGYANYLLAEIYGAPLDVLDGSCNYAGNTEVLDLTLLCFRSEFVDEESITSIRKIANTFVADYIGNYGETAFLELLGSSGDVGTVDSFAQTLSAYYANQGIDHTPTTILYRLGGKSYDYIVKCPYAVMYIEKDWTDANKDLCPYTYDNFLHENYSDTKQFFTINIRQMEQHQDLYALDSYNHNLKIYFTNYQYSYYNGIRHSIGLANTASFVHEYIHALTLASSMNEDWARDGFARYFSYRYDYYGIAMSTVDYNSVPDIPQYHWIHEYKQNIGRDIDMETDFAELQHIATYVNGYDDPNDGGGYTAGASFVAYLISRFGEEKLIEIVCKTHDFGEYTYGELVADWQSFLSENYALYTRVK